MNNEVLQEIANMYGNNVPTSTTHRKWIDTHTCGTCDPSDIEVLNRHMSHSSATTRKWYQMPKTQHALQLVDCIKKLSKQYFTKEEDIKLNTISINRK